MQIQVCKTVFTIVEYDGVFYPVCGLGNGTVDEYVFVDYVPPVVYTPADFVALSTFVIYSFVVAFGVRTMLRLFSGTQKT